MDLMVMSAEIAALVGNLTRFMEAALVEVVD
jgi:hypothetical protein